MNDEIPINEDADNHLVKQYEECQITLFKMLEMARADERRKCQATYANLEDQLKEAYAKGRQDERKENDKQRR